MNYLKHLLSLLIIYCCLNLIKAKAINITLWETEDDLAAWDRVHNQMEAVKAGNDILKLRLEMMELQIGKLAYFVTGIDQKLQTIEESIEKLHLALRPQPVLEKLDHSLTVNRKELENEIEPFGNSTTDETPIEDKSQADLVETEKVILSGINGELIICESSGDKSLKCFNAILPTNCDDANSKACWNNTCYIHNSVHSSKPFLLSCDNTTDDGGWTVIQRRINGSVDFFRGWSDYKEGFGDINGEFWIGLDKLYALTNTLGPVELYVRLIDFDDVEQYAKYDSFAIGDEQTQYVLKDLGTYSGTAGDSLRYHANMKFTTKDRDNDNYSNNCAQLRSGAWWYDNCSKSNLNSRYFGVDTKPVKGAWDGVNWYSFHDADYSMKFAQMMIRPRRA